MNVSGSASSLGTGQPRPRTGPRTRSEPPFRAELHRPAAPARPPELVPYYVWDVVVRVTHWAIVLSILVLAVTGFYIGRPFLVVPGEAGARFVMGTARAIHSYAAIVFGLAVASRIVWLFTGPYYARWHQLLPVHRRRLRGLWPTFLFYVFVRRTPPRVVGHNPLAGVTYLAVFGLYLAAIVTGLALYAASNPGSWLGGFAVFGHWLGGLQATRFLHHVVMWLLLGFMIHHIASGVLMARVEKNATMDSIFSGFKYVRPEDVEADRRDATL